MTTSTSRADLDFLRSAARDQGFDVCEMAPLPDDWPAASALKAFIAEGRHGTMGWMARTLHRRSHPTAMWPQARSAVVVGMNYGPAEDPLAALRQRSRAAISVYAQGRDYHGLIKGRLKHLANALTRRLGGKARVFVDTAPLMEKPLAALAGVGWQGKHTNLVSRDFGSWLFLGVILSNLELKTAEPAEDACGSCRACLDVCPTNAFPAPYQLDASACLSYLTIEHIGPIPEKFRAAMGNRIFGCDDCLAVCPWNKFARVGRETKLQARNDLKAPALAELASLDDAAFRSRFSGSAVKRIGRDRFVRNVLYALGNSGDARLAPAAEERLEDSDQTVREAARWALDRLAAPD